MRATDFLLYMIPFVVAVLVERGGDRLRVAAAWWRTAVPDWLKQLLFPALSFWLTYAASMGANLPVTSAEEITFTNLAPTLSAVLTLFFNHTRRAKETRALLARSSIDGVQPTP